MTSLSRMTVFLTEVACSIGSTYVKCTDTESASIEGAGIAGTCIRRTCNEGAYIDSTCAKSACTRANSNKDVCVKSFYVVDCSGMHSQPFRNL